MAKAILEFDLNDPEDAALHRKAADVQKVHSFLWQYDQWMRKYIKYADRDTWPSLGEVREKFHELLDEHDVKME